jgi:fructose-bisphosphate aldolase, class II
MGQTPFIIRRTMGVPTTEQYAAMLDAAAAGGYAYPAVNVTSSQTLNAAIRGFADVGSDGIVEVTTGSGEYLAGESEDAARGARALASFAHEVADAYPVSIALHTDHCPPEQVATFLRPLITESRARRERGERPLFNSHMFDGSTLPLNENLRLSAELLDECASVGLVLELECGVVGGEEDAVSAAGVPADRLYTTTNDLLRVAEVLGAGERGRYLLAATFGNVHGVHPSGHVRLRPEILRQGQEALAATHPGARFQYVFHGSSGSSDEDIRAAISYGVVKINIDSDAQYAFTRAVADHVFTGYTGVLKVDGTVGDKKAYDPRTWGRRAEKAMAAHVAQACELFGCAGRSLTT